MPPAHTTWSSSATAQQVASAALEAAAQGAQRIVILEKCVKGGGNSFVSSANMTFPMNFNDEMLRDEGHQWTDYLTEATQHPTPREVIREFATGLYELPDWLKSLGGELDDTNYDKMQGLFRTHSRPTFILT